MSEIAQQAAELLDMLSEQERCIIYELIKMMVSSKQLDNETQS